MVCMYFQDMISAMMAMAKILTNVWYCPYMSCPLEWSPTNTLPYPVMPYATSNVHLPECPVVTVKKGMHNMALGWLYIVICMQTM